MTSNVIRNALDLIGIEKFTSFEEDKLAFVRLQKFAEHQGLEITNTLNLLEAVFATDEAYRNSSAFSNGNGNAERVPEGVTAAASKSESSFEAEKESLQAQHWESLNAIFKPNTSLLEDGKAIKAYAEALRGDQEPKATDLEDGTLVERINVPTGRLNYVLNDEAAIEALKAVGKENLLTTAQAAAMYETAMTQVLEEHKVGYYFQDAPDANNRRTLIFTPPSDKDKAETVLSNLGNVLIYARKAGLYEQALNQGPNSSISREINFTSADFDDDKNAPSTMGCKKTDNPTLQELRQVYIQHEAASVSRNSLLELEKHYETFLENLKNKNPEQLEPELLRLKEVINNFQKGIEKYKPITPFTLDIKTNPETKMPVLHVTLTEEAYRKKSAYEVVGGRRRKIGTVMEELKAVNNLCHSLLSNPALADNIQVFDKEKEEIKPNSPKHFELFNRKLHDGRKNDLWQELNECLQAAMPGRDFLVQSGPIEGNMMKVSVITDTTDGEVDLAELKEKLETETEYTFAVFELESKPVASQEFNRLAAAEASGVSNGVENEQILSKQVTRALS